MKYTRLKTSFILQIVHPIKPESETVHHTLLLFTSTTEIYLPVSSRTNWTPSLVGSTFGYRFDVGDDINFHPQKS